MIRGIITILKTSAAKPNAVITLRCLKLKSGIEDVMRLTQSPAKAFVVFLVNQGIKLRIAGKVVMATINMIIGPKAARYAYCFTDNRSVTANAEKPSEVVSEVRKPAAANWLWSRWRPVWGLAPDCENGRTQPEHVQQRQCR